MPRKTKKTTAQIYDSSLKTLLQGQAEDVFRALNVDISIGNELGDELGQETIRPVLRVDRVYRAALDGEPIIFHTEMETGQNEKMLDRMLEYFAILWKKFRLPIFQLLIYPFRTKLPSPFLNVKVGGRDVLSFNCQIVALWELNAEDYIQQKKMCVYPLLPTMCGASYRLLKQALDELYAWCELKRRHFGELLILFDVFLQRSDTVSAADKRKLGKELEMYDRLIQQSRFVKKAAKQAREEGREEGKAEGKAEGLTAGMRKLAKEVVQEHNQLLAELVEARLASIQDPQALQKAALAIIVACSAGEDQVHLVLDTLVPAPFSGSTLQDQSNQPSP